MNIQHSVSESTANVSKVSPRGRLSSGEPNPVDVHVGQRVRLRRVLLGISQEKLGAALGITFQQVQKYERGANRIGASRLWDLSLVLKCPVSFFFEDMATHVAEASPRNLNRLGTATLPDDVEQELQEEVIGNRESMELLRAFHLVKDERVRRRLRDLLKSLSLAEESDVTEQLYNSSTPEYRVDN